jgi:hypothetical protein
MPSSATRHRVEIPLGLYQALIQAAADAAMPTSALITRWLLHMLQVRHPDLHVRDPFRSGVEQFERRPRRLGELPDDVPLSALLAPPVEDDALPPAGASLPATDLTTVRFSSQEGGMRPRSDRRPPSRQCWPHTAPCQRRHARQSEVAPRQRRCSSMGILNRSGCTARSAWSSRAACSRQPR